MNLIDWNQLRAFLAAAEAGSLSAAARQLGLSQPTLSRQVAAIESRLGVTLFERVGKTMQLTVAGLDLLEHARAMGAAADALSLAASGQAQAVEGVVTVSASDVVAACLLPPMVRQLRHSAPGIALELVPSNAFSGLLDVGQLQHGCHCALADGTGLIPILIATRALWTGTRA